MVNQEENYVLHCNWEEGTNPEIRMDLPVVDLSGGYLTFRIADQREESATDNHGLFYRVTLVDQSGNTVSIDSPRYIYPSLALQLYKQDVLFGSYEYKHQMQMVVINRELFE